MEVTYNSEEIFGIILRVPVHLCLFVPEFSNCRYRHVDYIRLNAGRPYFYLRLYNHLNLGHRLDLLNNRLDWYLWSRFDHDDRLLHLLHWGLRLWHGLRHRLRARHACVGCCNCIALTLGLFNYYSCCI